MGFNRYRQRFTAWIACLAILMAALAPAISHALAASGKGSSAAWDEVCTVDGVKSLHEHGAHDSGPADNGMHFEHCPFCFTHAASFGLPPSAQTFIPLAAGSPVRPLLFFHSPRPLFAWAAAHPRAPPVVS
ncbi:MAG: DUF2946 domain-containing protein [Bacillota bacterium]